MLNLENGLIWKIQPDYAAVYMPCGVIVGITVEYEWACNKVNVYWLCSPGAPTYSNLTPSWCLWGPHARIIRRMRVPEWGSGEEIARLVRFLRIRADDSLSLCPAAKSSLIYASGEVGAMWVYMWWKMSARWDVCEVWGSIVVIQR